MTLHSSLISQMIKYFSGDPKRIHHFLKVYSFAKTIGESEGLPEETQFILETTAIVHDIGIKVSEQKYGSSNGKYQEIEGPSIAKPILEAIGYPNNIIDRVCYIIAHHHTYSAIDGQDYQILVEADFLVNLYEDDLSQEAIQNAYDRIFKTETGKAFCQQIYFE